jgi:hypothetical protein
MRTRAERATFFKAKTGGAAPNAASRGWVLAILAMLAPRGAARGSGLLRSPLRGPLTLCPPDLAGQAGFQRC